MYSVKQADCLQHFDQSFSINFFLALGYYFLNVGADAARLQKKTLSFLLIGLFFVYLFILDIQMIYKHN